MSPSQPRVVPQVVQWGPVDGRNAGVRVWTTDHTEEAFIPWATLRSELERFLLPQLFADPKGYVFVMMDYHGKKDWLVRLARQNGEVYGRVWFGSDPDDGWAFDGMIRIGDLDDDHRTVVWQTYQRYSDGTYRRLPSATATIDELIRQRPASRQPPQDAA